MILTRASGQAFMSYQDTNRFMELRKALQRMASPANVRQSLRGPATVAGLRATEQIKKNTPVGRVEPSYPIVRPSGSRVIISHGRPSLRLFGVTLANAWNAPQVNDDGDSVTFTVTSSAPHMKFLIDGTPGHDIPKRTPGPMSFWSFAHGGAFISKWDEPFIARHPGIMPSGMVKTSLMNGLEKDINQQQAIGLKNTAKPLNEFFTK